MSIETFQIIYTAILGLLVGSFLNVVISRLPSRLVWGWKKDSYEFLDMEESSKYKELINQEPPGIVVKRSFCPKCNSQISWYDNIPLVSYLLLRGKCRSCKTRIPLQYPLIEIAMAVLAVLAVINWGWNIHGLMGAMFFGVLLVCSAIDFKTQLIPDQIILPATWIALLFFYWQGNPEHILGAAFGYMILWVVFWVFKLLTKKEGMGYGDFKLLAFIGAFLGIHSIIPTLLISTVIGSIIGIILLKIRKESLPFAFGPYLAIGGFIYALFELPIKNIMF